MAFKVKSKKVTSPKEKKVYFFTKDEKALAVRLGSGKIPINTAEQKARTYACKHNLELAGGYDTTGKPTWVKKTINVPFKTKGTPDKNDLVSYIMAYEDGSLSEKDTLKFFQHLEDTGQAYSLQGNYGRTATALIGAGLIKPNMKIHSKEQVAKLKQEHEVNKAFSNF